MRFLIVDDDKNIRILLGMFLAAYGNSQSAASGEEALEIFSRTSSDEPFDVVFLDITMPGLSGHEVAERMREIEREKSNNGPEFKLIMASAYDDAENIRKCYEVTKADGFLVKPFYEEEVVEQLTKLGIAKP